MGFPAEFPAQCFLGVTLFGHFAMLAMAPWLLVALAVLIYPKRGWIMATSVTVASLVLIALAVDSIVFGLFRFHLNGMVWSLIRNGNLSDILPLTANTLIIAAALVIGSFLLEAFVAWLVWKFFNAWKGRGKWAALVVVALLLAIQVIHIFADANRYVPITRMSRFLPAFHPLTAKRTLRKLGWMKDVKDAPSVFHTGKSALHYPLQNPACQPPPHPLNLVLVVIDCWRYDVLNEKVTPNLWQFSQSNIRFDQHYSPANGTRFGIFSLFYGIYGSYWHAMLAELRGPVLVSELNRAKYQFGLFTSAPLSSPEFDRTVFVEVRDKIPPHSNIGTIENDRQITKQMVSFLQNRSREQPFFGFLFYDSLHAGGYPPDVPAPFQPDQKVDHLKLSADFDATPIRNRYFNAAHYVDGLVADVLKELEKQSCLDNTVVMVTADHGEEFNENKNNYWGHNSNFSRYQTGVPLIVHWPGKPAGTISYATTHLDIVPTLMKDLLNCSSDPATYSQGYALFDDKVRFPFLASTWRGFAIVDADRIDVMYETETESFDKNYRKISTPPPAKSISAAIEGNSRFYAR